MDPCVFFNTTVTNNSPSITKWLNREEGLGLTTAKALIWIGDWGLTPARWLFGGRVLTIEGNTPNQHVMEGYESFCSGDTDNVKMAIAIALLVPGLFLSLFKLFACLSKDVRDQFSFLKGCLNRRNITLGSPDDPITTIAGLKDAINAAHDNNRLAQPTDAVIIHGRNLAIEQHTGQENDPWAPFNPIWFLRLKPMKIILTGNNVTVNDTFINLFNLKSYVKPNQDAASAKWDLNFNKTFHINPVSSVEEALAYKLPRRGRFTCARVHMMFQVNPLVNLQGANSI